MPFNIPPVDRSLSRLLPVVVLASQSKARRELLAERGCRVIVSPTFGDESIQDDHPARTVEQLAMRKLELYLATAKQIAYPVLAADTLIYFQGRFIGKSRDRNEAFAHLSRFSATSHEVYSGFALYHPALRETMHGFDKAQVEFEQLDDLSINRYLDTGEWEHAAGSYRIQQAGKSLVKSIIGDYCTVVGLPIQTIFGILGRLVLPVGQA